MRDENARSDLPVTQDHRRQWRKCLYVYPVISRRSKGLSIGVNLNPDKRCTFRCLYCQINRRIRRDLRSVDLPILRDELKLALQESTSGRLWEEPRFASTPKPMRRVNDIAFSGDGEPTCLAEFDQAVEIAALARSEVALPDLKIVIITNSTQLDSPQVRRALPILDASNGEIWAKLDAGTEEYFQQINQPNADLRLQHIVDGITGVAKDRPIVIQTLLLRLDSALPSDAELDAYCARLREIRDADGKIRLVQLHTIARAPDSARVAALSDEELDAAGAKIRAAIQGVPIETFYGYKTPPQAK
jgi:wyosine [tRNA(Phe)-imidazoG37] synthetase (radical SAM superfamily)